MSSAGRSRVLREILERLIQSTKNENIVWQTTDGDTSYYASLGTSQVIVSRMPAFEQYRFEIVSQEGVINTDITVSERRAMFAVDDYAPEIIDLFANVEKQVNAIPDELMDVLQSLKNIEGDG